MKRTACSLTTLLLAGAAANAGVWSFSDNEFSSPDWTNSAYTIMGDVDAIVLHQPNGDPADNGYLSMEIVAGGNGAGSAISFSNHAVYDPSSEGAVGQLSYELLGRTQSTLVLGFSQNVLAIEQGGQIYVHVDNGTADDLGEWMSSGGVLTAEDFWNIDPATFDFDLDAHPDFSAGGSAIRFGLTAAFHNTDQSNEGWEIQDYDELTLQIVGIPAPGAAGLFGLAGLAATRRRR